MRERESFYDTRCTNSFICREDPPFRLVSGRETFYSFDCNGASFDAHRVCLIGGVMCGARKDVVKSENNKSMKGREVIESPCVKVTSLFKRSNFNAGTPGGK